MIQRSMILCVVVLTESGRHILSPARVVQTMLSNYGGKSLSTKLAKPKVLFVAFVVST